MGYWVYSGAASADPHGGALDPAHAAVSSDYFPSLRTTYDISYNIYH